jgi:hypothetical protein
MGWEMKRDGWKDQQALDHALGAREVEVMTLDREVAGHLRLLEGHLDEADPEVLIALESSAVGGGGLESDVPVDVSRDHVPPLGVGDHRFERAIELFEDLVDGLDLGGIDHGLDEDEDQR